MSKICSLQSVRCFAIVGVITSHCPLGNFGAFGVSLFIILSGFVMFYNYQNRRIGTGILKSLKFSIGKIKKLYLLHILTLILPLALTIYQLTKQYSCNSLLVLLFKFFSNILLIQDWFPNTSIYFSLNSVAWYLSLCLFLYFIFPTVLNNLRMFSSYQALITIVILFGVQFAISISLKFINVNIYLIDNFIHWFTYIFPVTRALDFIIGCCLSIIFCNVTKVNKQDLKFKACLNYTIIEIIVLIMSISAYYYIFLERKTFLGSESFVYTTIYTPCSLLLVLLFAIQKGMLSILLTNKLTIWIGDLSGYLFLIHFPVISMYNIITGKLNLISTSLTKFIIIMVVSILLSIAYKKLENRILKNKN